MGWNWPWGTRSGKDDARLETRMAGGPPGLVALHMQGDAVFTRADYGALAREGFMRNPVVHRCVRMGAAAASLSAWWALGLVMRLFDARETASDRKDAA